VCHERLATPEHVCSVCRTALHHDCARNLGRCPSLGCTGQLGTRRVFDLGQINQTRVAGILILVLSVLLFAVALCFVDSARTKVIQRLAERGVRGDAVITRLTPSNHNQMWYEYKVDGITYFGNDFADGHRLGDRLVVLYLPEDPKVFVRGTNAANYTDRSEIPVVPFFLFAMILGGRLVIGDTTRKK
jgi:hypothetical protein